MSMPIFSRLYSFFIYVSIIIATMIFTIAAENRKNNNKQFEYILFSVIAVIIPCIFAAFRGEAVGTDVRVYAKPAYVLAKNMQSIQLLWTQKVRYEFGYMLMAYVSSHVFHSFNVMLFFTQLLIVLPIYILAFKVNEVIPARSIMLCFYSFFYLMTFNIMREGISVSLVLLSYYYFINKKWVKGGICVVIGLFFHSSAILGAGLGLFVLILVEVKNKQTRAILVTLAVICVPLVLGNWKAIFNALISYNVLPKKYSFYMRYLVDSYLIGLNRAYFYKMVLRCSAFFGPYLLLNKSQDFMKSVLGRFIETGTFLGLLIYTSVLLILNTGYGYRVSLYLEMLLILWVAGLTAGNPYFQPDKTSKRTIMFSGIVMLWFLVAYIWRGFHGSMPFYFQLYNI